MLRFLLRLLSKKNVAKPALYCDPFKIIHMIRESKDVLL